MADPILKYRLESLYRTFDRGYLHSDPLKFVYRYTDTQDKEIAGLFSAVLAYGGVKQVFTSLERVLAPMGDSPYRFIMGFEPKRGLDIYRSFKHRFNTGFDIALLCNYLRQIYENHATLGDFFMQGYRPSAATIEESLSDFVDRIWKLDCSPFYANGLPRSASVRYFLSSPINRSACKRMNLYLRWMVRSADDIDCGLWGEVKASQLILPLDTHTSRLCRYIGLTDKRSTSWDTAVAITQKLKLLAPDDPVKYDFALSRLGILDICKHTYVPEICEKCTLYTMCTLTEHARDNEYVQHH